jgi:hypothetical protein
MMIKVKKNLTEGCKKQLNCVLTRPVCSQFSSDNTLFAAVVLKKEYLIQQHQIL